MSISVSLRTKGLSLVADLGSVSNTEASLRCAQDSRNIYFLIEVSEAHLSSDDYVTVMMSQTNASGAVSHDARRIKVGPRGVISTEKYAGAWEYSEMGATVASAYDGTLDASGDTDNGYIVEIAVSRTSFNAADGLMLINFAMSSNDDAGRFIGEDAISVQTDSTTGWIEVTGI